MEKGKFRIKIIKNESENLFASNVEEFMTDPNNIILGPPQYLINENYYVAIIEYDKIPSPKERSL
ncbi:hypothetical protein [Erysipelothrix anatis]|uniref:hypothetical protein n=1 Tax=Erysipelothrix anatis TaxID=2683713 RepID=UPI001358AB76|nr:hypothetical protein [Erysipelothrix anatis]